MRVLILANGAPPSSQIAHQRALESELIIATDGAATTAHTIGIYPHIICGDFDSITQERANQLFPNAELIVAANQDYADLEKALRVAKERGATEVTILGAIGGRLDHTLANLALMLTWHKEIPIRIEEESTHVWSLSASTERTAQHTLTTTPNDIISIITVEPSIVTIRGTQWDVENLQILPGTRGVSNVAKETQVVVEIKQGSIFLIHTMQNQT